jgi:hypothetical protein
VVDRRGASPVERAQLPRREGLRALTLDAVLIQFAPTVLVGDDLAAAVDERVDALREGLAAVVDAALRQSGGDGPGGNEGPLG